MVFHRKVSDIFRSFEGCPVQDPVELDVERVHDDQVGCCSNKYAADKVQQYPRLRHLAAVFQPISIPDSPCPEGMRNNRTAIATATVPSVRRSAYQGADTTDGGGIGYAKHEAERQVPVTPGPSVLDMIAIPIGTIIMVVAVFDIHIERNAVMLRGIASVSHHTAINTATAAIL